MHLRSDSAGYQKDLIRYCAEGSDPRFEVISFVIAARVGAKITNESKMKAPRFNLEKAVESSREWLMC